jgi:hypothetical protein
MSRHMRCSHHHATIETAQGTASNPHAYEYNLMHTIMHASTMQHDRDGASLRAPAGRKAAQPLVPMLCGWLALATRVCFASL